MQTRRYRPARGSFQAAMSEMQTVSSKDDIARIVGTEPENLSTESYFGDDDRIGWKDVHIVMRKRTDKYDQTYWDPCGYVEGHFGPTPPEREEEVRAKQKRRL